MTMLDTATPHPTPPHTSRATKNLVEEFGWESKLAEFYEEGMRKLMTRWDDLSKNGLRNVGRVSSSESWGND
ncbi:hypothetical protein ACTXT7_015285 [Hymenolepis weldensis]